MMKKTSDYVDEVKDFTSLILQLSTLKWDSPVKVNFWQMHGPSYNIDGQEVNAVSMKMDRPLYEFILHQVSQDLLGLQQHPQITEYYLGLYLMYERKDKVVDATTFLPVTPKPVLRFSKYTK